MSDWKSIDSWWKAVLLLGVLSSAAATMFSVEFINRKHLFGLGLGMILIGISYWIAQKHASAFGYGGLFKWKEIRHNTVTGILLIIGIVLVFLFGFLIVKSLI